MKTTKVIKKNIRLLLRSKVSTLVLILGPLLVMFLVGISFSSSSFNLKMNVFSNDYSDLTQDFILKLENEGYAIQKAESNETCINQVKEQLSHACIIFPDNLQIDNKKTNIIDFYVDQSKVNIVYLIMSTLEESFGQVTTDISTDLTNQIVTTLFDTKNNLDDAKILVNDIISSNSLIIGDSQTAQNNLQGLNFDSGSTGTANVDLLITNTKKDLDAWADESYDIIDDVRNLIEDIDDHGSLTNNQSDDLDLLEDEMVQLDDLTTGKSNATLKKIDQITSGIDAAINSLSKKLNDAKSTNDQVINRIETIKTNSNSLKDKATNLQNNINSMINQINSVQITNIENIVSPIKTNINYVLESESNLNFLFPSLIVILIMFIGLLLPATLIVMEKNSKAAFRVFVTPTKPMLYIISNYFTSLILISLQIFIVLGVSQFYFNIKFNSVFMVIFSLFLIITLFILIGMLIGDSFNSEEMAMLTSVSIGTVFLLLSGIIFPIESMPQYIADKIIFNPVVVGSETFKRAMLFGSGYSSLKEPLMILILSILLIIGLIVGLKKLRDYRMQRPKQSKIKKGILINHFNFGERKAKNLAEFIVAIQNLNDEQFNKILDEDAYRLYSKYVLKNKRLTKELVDKNDKNEILQILVTELRKSQKSRNKP
jgi:ABC-type multidrug transport system permease subunit